jgi:hypothetical protein
MHECIISMLHISRPAGFIFLLKIITFYYDLVVRILLFLLFVKSNLRANNYQDKNRKNDFRISFILPNLDQSFPQLIQ